MRPNFPIEKEKISASAEAGSGKGLLNGPFSETPESSPGPGRVLVDPKDLESPNNPEGMSLL